LLGISKTVEYQTIQSIASQTSIVEPAKNTANVAPLAAQYVEDVKEEDCCASTCVGVHRYSPSSFKKYQGGRICYPDVVACVYKDVVKGKLV
jgi:hypothetical protein